MINDHSFTSFFLSLLKCNMHSAGDAQRREDNGWESPLFPGCEDSPGVTTTRTFSSALSWREGGIAGRRADRDIFKAGKELSLWV